MLTVAIAWNQQHFVECSQRLHGDGQVAEGSQRWWYPSSGEWIDGPGQNIRGGWRQIGTAPTLGQPECRWTSTAHEVLHIFKDVAIQALFCGCPS